MINNKSMTRSLQTYPNKKNKHGESSKKRLFTALLQIM